MQSDAGAGSRGIVEAAEAAFRLGEATLTDYVETLRAVLEARLSALEVTGNALAAQRRLERLAGIPVTGADPDLWKKAEK